jgi:hypothetical protein
LRQRTECDERNDRGFAEEAHFPPDVESS